MLQPSSLTEPSERFRRNRKKERKKPKEPNLERTPSPSTAVCLFHILVLSYIYQDFYVYPGELFLIKRDIPKNN